MKLLKAEWAARRRFDWKQWKFRGSTARVQKNCSKENSGRYVLASKKLDAFKCGVVVLFTSGRNMSRRLPPERTLDFTKSGKRKMKRQESSLFCFDL